MSGVSILITGIRDANSTGYLTGRIPVYGLIIRPFKFQISGFDYRIYAGYRIL
jgi:hypothetical protein